MGSITSAILGAACVIDFGFALVPKAVAQAVETPGAVGIRNVTVIDVRTGRSLAARTVLVEGQRIRAVTADRDATVPKGARVIDGTGKYLLPGLWDMHAHFSKKTAPDVDMPQYLAYGVTGVREMQTWTECPPAVADDACLDEKQEWKRRVLSGNLAGPRLLAISSNLVNGPPPPGAPRRTPAFLNQETADDGRQLARYLKDRGVDFIKIYNGVPRDVYFALMDEARRIGIDAAGHKPFQISAVELSEAGQRSVEHVQNVQSDCWPGAEDLRKPDSRLSPEILRRMVDEYDAAICQRILQTFVKNRTWFVPTLVVRRSEAYAHELARGTDPRAKYVTATRWSGWLASTRRIAATRDSATRMGFYLKSLELTGQAHRAGVRILVGTDAGVPFVFKGSGFHEEMAELVTAGLTPGAVLKAATLDAAEFLGQSSEFGTIDTGKIADLVLIDADPIADIRNTQQIHAVVLNGRYFDRRALDELLAASVAAAARGSGGG